MKKIFGRHMTLTPTLDFTARTSFLASFSVLAGAGLVLMDPLSTSVAAQNGRDGKARSFERQLEEIVITAQKRQSTVLDTPIAVTAIGGAEIDRAQTRDIRDIQTLVPALQVVQFASASNASFSIRGVGSSTFNFGIEPAVGVFVDGVYRSRNGASISDFLGMERIEVLRGPQSTLFGKNTTAGVINFITQKPSYEWGLEGEATYGRFNQLILKAGLEGGVIDEKAAFRIDAYSNKRDGFIQDVVLDRGVNERNRAGVRGQILLEPSPSVTLRMIADYNDISEACCAAPFVEISEQAEPIFDALGIIRSDPVNAFSGQTAVDSNVLSDLQTWGFSNQLDWDLDNFTVTAITAWRNFDEIQDIDADFSSAPINNTRRLNQSYDTFTQEIRFTSTTDGPVQWLAGAYYLEQDLIAGNLTEQGPALRPFSDLLFNSSQIAALDPFFAPLGFQTNGSLISLIEGLNGLPAGTFLAEGSGLEESQFFQENQNFSLFAQADWHVTDRLTVTGGLRYTNDRRSLTSILRINDPFAELNLLEEFAGDFSVISQTATTATIIQGGLAAGLSFEQASNPSINPGFAQFDAIQQQVNAGLEQPLFQGYAALSAVQFFPPAPEVSDSREDNDLSGNIIISYDIDDDLNLYGSYTAGFKAGGFALDAAAARVGDFTFDPETVTAWELGFKGRFFDALSANIAIFTQTVNDFQANVFTGTSFVPDNAGSLNLSGLEFDGIWTPSGNWQFTGAFSWLFEGEYGEFPNGPCPAIIPEGVNCTPIIPEGGVVPVNVQDLGGQEISSTAEFRGTLTATYSRPVGDDLQIYVRGEVSYQSRVFLTTELDPRQVQTPFALAAGSLGFGRQDGAWELQFYIRNAFDSQFLQGSFNSTIPGGNINGYPGDPRTFGGSLRFRL